MRNDGCSRECYSIDRRTLLTRMAPACALGCAGISVVPTAGLRGMKTVLQEPHKFDVPREITLTARQRAQMMNRGWFEFIKTLQEEMDRPELLRFLNANSAKMGTQTGQRQAQQAPDDSFQSFVSVFRSPQMNESLSLEIIEDTDKVFQLSVTECIWADTVRSAGFDGEVGHAIVCNMDYHWPPAFNPEFRMERTKTLMQGHDECNHRYIDTA